MARVIMTRIEAMARIARSDLARLAKSERILMLETMLGEAWDTDPGWAALSADLREELENGSLKEEPFSSRYDPALLLSIAHEYRGVTNEYLAQRLIQIDVPAASIVGRPMAMAACPCCGYRTLDTRGHYDICDVCWWEDDGQDNETGDETWGGPNGHLSLSEARANFFLHVVSDPPREDLRSRQRPDTKFARDRHSILLDDEPAVEETSVGWRSRPLQQSFRSPRNDA